MQSTKLPNATIDNVEWLCRFSVWVEHKGQLMQWIVGKANQVRFWPDKRMDGLYSPLIIIFPPS